MLKLMNFFLGCETWVDTKVPKNQGKKNATRSANRLSGSNKTTHFLPPS
jgi:hypothetical protein